MLAIDRRKSIMKMLVQYKSVTVTELSKVFKITEETVRRDLEKLEKDGLLKRTYGGAVLVDNVTEDLPVSVREISNIEGKEAVGKKASDLVEDGDVLMLDSSTTALQVAKNIKNKTVTVITNSEKVVIELAGVQNIKVISTGGTLRPSSMSFVGPQAENSATQYNGDLFFMSCGGISVSKGLTDTNELEAEMKKVMMGCARHVVLLIDHTKINRTGFVKIGPFSKISTIIVDTPLPCDLEDELKNNNVKIVICDEH